MSKTTLTNLTTENAKQKLDALLERHKKLEMQAQVEKYALEQAQAQAMELFGTTDLDAIRAMILKTKEENAKAWDSFVAEMTEFESAILEVEASIEEYKKTSQQ